MSITFEVLGAPGKDNALLVLVDSGQEQSRLLFDCGENCLSNLGVSDVKSIHHLFFSHLHMDHISGFDTFFRINYSRDSLENHIWGPPKTSTILHHRFRGFMWNLHQNMSSSWLISNISDNGVVETYKYELNDAFETEQKISSENTNFLICKGTGYSVYAITLNHNTPSIGYLVKEDDHLNIDISKLTSLGLHPGPWLRELKDNANQPENITIEGREFSCKELYDTLIIRTKGESIAYLTDFLMDESTFTHLIEFLYKCDTIICESQYRETDQDLAITNYHTTSTQSAKLAKQAKAGKLILFHISARYLKSERIDMLNDARTIFAQTYYPPHWGI